MSDWESLQHKPRIRVAAYVLRPREGLWDLLVFEQIGQPDAGLQVPAGGVEPGESLTDAVRREVREETGLTVSGVPRQLVVEDKPHPVTGQRRCTTFFVVDADPGGADSWVHTVGGEDSDSGLVFACRFIPLPLPQPLADDQDRWLGEIDRRFTTVGR